MSLLSQLMQQGAASLMVDPTQQQRQELNDLCGHPALNGQDIGLTSFLTQVQSSMAASLIDMDIKIPMMGAHETMQKRMGVLDGQYPGTDGGAQFNNVFQDVTQGPTLLQGLHSRLKQLLDNAPPPTTLPDGTVQPSPAIEQAQQMVAESSTGFSALTQGAASAFSAVQTSIGDYAFLSFLTMQHSPAVQKILSSVVPVVPAGLKQEQDMLSNSSSCLKQPTFLAEGSVLNKPQMEQPQQLDPVEAQQLRANITADKANFNIEEAKLTEATNACADWQTQNNYAEARRNKDSSPEAAAHWEQLQQRYKTEAYAPYKEQLEATREAKKAYTESMTEYSTRVRS